MGFTIMESFMDDVQIESVLGLGTKIKMRKKIKRVPIDCDLEEEDTKELASFVGGF